MTRIQLMLLTITTLLLCGNQCQAGLIYELDGQTVVGSGVTLTVSGSITLDMAMPSAAPVSVSASDVTTFSLTVTDGTDSFALTHLQGFDGVTANDSHLFWNSGGNLQFLRTDGALNTRWLLFDDNLQVRLLPSGAATTQEGNQAIGSPFAFANIAAVPEPSTLLPLASLISAVVFRRRR